MDIQAQRKDTLSKPTTKIVSGSWNFNYRLFSFGLGAPVLYPYYFRAIESDQATNTKPTDYTEVFVQHAKFEFGVIDHIGCAITFNRSVSGFTENYYQSNGSVMLLKSNPVVMKMTTVNFRLNFHFLNNKLIDPYIGVGAGLRKTYFDTPSRSFSGIEQKIRLASEISFGIRAMIKSRIGVYAEIGIGRSIAQAGLCLNVGKIKRNYSEREIRSR